MPEYAWTALAAILAAATGALVAPMFRRKHDAAETTEIVDRIAREWIKTLENEVEALKSERDEDKRQIAGLIKHVGVLENHINARKNPPPPPRPVFG